MPDYSNIELGNLAYGHSRGEWPVPRTARYELPLDDLFEAMNGNRYGLEFSNDVFEMRPYWWGECCYDEPCPADCPAVLPNFKHKPSGLELRWYKYALRDSYMSREVDPKEWRQICEDCIASIGITR